MAITTREQLIVALSNYGLVGNARLGNLDGLFATGPTTVDAITDASAVAKVFLKAADAPAARTAIGAGTSNLAVGTTAATAKAGNYVPTSAEVAAGLKAKTQINALASLTGTPDAAALTVAVNAIIAALKA